MPPEMSPPGGRERRGSLFFESVAGSHPKVDTEQHGFRVYTIHL